MRLGLGAGVLALAIVGCSLKLPEIPANHPASSGSPDGLVYATPAVLEVRPPDLPSTQPDTPHGQHSEEKMPAGEAPRHSPAQTAPAHEHSGHNMQQGEHRGNDVARTLPGAADAPADQHPGRTQGQRRQQTIREGQHHE